MKKLQRLFTRLGRLFVVPAMLAAFLLPTASSISATYRSVNTAVGSYSSPALTGSVQHVFVIVMENKGYSQVWNTGSTPYITSLGKSYARATAYHAITHPSLPDYLDLYGGSNYGITTDCSPSSSCHISSSHYSIAYDFLNAGLSFKLYMESMPSACYLTTSGNYAPKHNPAIYFDGTRLYPSFCNAHDVPFSAFATDIASASTTPNFSFISPNLCNDMHDCSVSTGDAWLKKQVPTILNSPACTSQKCLVIITWDEDNGNYGNRVLTIFAGTAAKTGGVVSSATYNHYSLLRTIEYIWGLRALTSNDANARPMTDLLR